MKIDPQIKKLLPSMIEHRRSLHKIPELCYQEIKTTAYLHNALKEIGLPFKTAGTGIVVNIVGTNAKKTIGFRADMDALSIEEKTECEYASQHKGRMHACGHDGHMAMLLGFAQYLKDHPPKDNVVLVFQPAEEGGLGAAKMIQSGLVQGI